MHSASPIQSLYQISSFPDIIKYSNGNLSLRKLVIFFSQGPIVICHEYLMKMTSIYQKRYQNVITSHQSIRVCDISLIEVFPLPLLTQTSIVLVIFPMFPYMQTAYFAPLSRWRWKLRNRVLGMLYRVISRSHTYKKYVKK